MSAKTLQMTMLFDFFGNLLTDKQQEYYDLYYNNDLSLSEIAENEGISRQGVRDIIVRAEATLRETEVKTGIIKRFLEIQAGVAEAERFAGKIAVIFRQHRNQSAYCTADETVAKSERLGAAMAFESLSEKLSAAFKKLRGKGRLSENDIKEAMREVRLALLEADVSYKVVRDFIKTVSERAVGTDVLESLTPAQMVIKIVNEELTSLMGGENTKIKISSKPPTVVMLVGLQGSGKTTNGAKLAAYMRKHNGKRPLLVACDIYRPAAIPPA